MATLIPFFFHWKVGEAPPFTGVAVNVAVVPGQNVLPTLEDIDTEAVTEELADILIVLLVTVAGTGQVALLVISTVTASPLTHELFVYVEPVPALTPFFFH